MNSQKYIPGFDYLKLFGCLSVALAHVWMNGALINIIGITALAYFSRLIGVSFFVSGYLSTTRLPSKKNPSNTLSIML